MKRLLATLAVVLIASTQPARAQQPAPVVDDVEGVLVDELVVQARLPGPAWWRVSDGDTTVYVLGVPDALPKGLKWDQTILKRRLTGAHTLITPPVYRASGNALAAPLIYARYRDASRSNTDLETVVPAPLWERFQRAVTRAGHRPKDYRDLKPFFAGIRLAGDYRKHVGLVYAEPLKSIMAAAKRLRLKATPAATEDTTINRLLEQLKALPVTAGVACLEAAIREIEAGDGAVRSAAHAWAAGDVGTALSAPRSSERCWAGTPAFGNSKRMSLAAQADAIERALRKPGHAVAVLSTRSLVAREGILQRLKAKGYRVRAPGEPDGA